MINISCIFLANFGTNSSLVIFIFKKIHNNFLIIFSFNDYLLFENMKSIYEIIPKEKLDVVSNSIEKAHGLPNECYLNDEYTLIERKKIFEEKWVVIGVASSLPKVGDAKPFNLLGIPLIILRDQNNKIKVSKLGQGLPVGGEIEQLDDGTLVSAFKNRVPVSSD